MGIERSGGEKLYFGVINAALAISGLLALIAGIHLMFVGDVDRAIKALGAGVVLMFAATIDRFESLKGLWMEVKLHKTIGEAEDLMLRLRDLAELTGETLVDLASRDGRLGYGASPRGSYELAQRVRETLERAEVDAAAIRRAVEPWARWALFDMARSVNVTIQHYLNEEARNLSRNDLDVTQRARAERADALLKVARSDAGISGPLSHFSNAVRAHMTEAMNALRPDDGKEMKARLEPWVAEMDYIAQHLELRDPEQWFAALRGPGIARG
jgi:hypothetical protein